MYSYIVKWIRLVLSFNILFVLIFLFIHKMDVIITSDIWYIFLKVFLSILYCIRYVENIFKNVKLFLEVFNDCLCDMTHALRMNGEYNISKLSSGIVKTSPQVCFCIFDTVWNLSRSKWGNLYFKQLS